jgi:DNA polymerase
LTTLWLDTETFSSIELKNGVYKYSQAVEVMLLAWAIDEGPVQVVDCTATSHLPAELMDALYTPSVELVAHNSMFDRTVLRHDRIFKRFDLPIERWYDTMVQALAHSLPAGLANLCEVLKVDQDKAKQDGGRALIMLFCKPRPKSSKLRRATRITHPVEWARFMEYAAHDISAMRECRRKMPTWNSPGAVWAWGHPHNKTHDRGICVDVELAQAAIAAVTRAQADLSTRTQEITIGMVESTTKRDQLLKEILATYGVDLPDMRKATLERRIEDPELPEGLKELLRIRLQASSTSTSKYKTLINSVDARGRLCGTKQFDGAARTGRWAGRLFQPDNLPRPTLAQEDIDVGITCIKHGIADLITDNVMELTSSAIRGCIIAPPGKKLVVADLSNIEGRAQAWLAGEDWKLAAFRAYDEGTGHDLYKLAYAGSFGVDPADVTKPQRQVGKVQELALGYEGGVGAFVTFAAAYGIDLVKMADDAQPHIPPMIWGQANIMLKWHREHKRDPARDFGMSDKTWLVCESFVLGWRSAHPCIKATWRQLRDAVRTAIMAPGKTIPCGYLKVRRDGAWLRVALPSGRSLCYPSPAIKNAGETCSHCEGVGAVSVDGIALDCTGCDGTGLTQATGGTISYWGNNQYSRKWSKLHTYGGKLFENVCQAVARDVMAHNMPAIEAAGYEIVLTVHDEVVTEAPDNDDFTHERLSSLLAANPPWAPDMPLAAAGFEAYRYKKE